MSEAEGGEETLAESSLLSHLLELRDRLLRALIATAVISVPCLYFANDIFTWLSKPLRDKLPAGAHLIATSVVAPFMTPFKLALLAAIYLAMPVILYQVWAFIAPGLYRHERRFALPLFVSSVILFYAGSVFSYFIVFPVIFNFFVMTTPVGVEMMTDMTQYMDFAVLLFFAFGLAFEIPVATVLLVRTGLVKREALTQEPGLRHPRNLHHRGLPHAARRRLADAHGGAHVRALRGRRPDVSHPHPRQAARSGARSGLMLHREMAETRPTSE